MRVSIEEYFLINFLMDFLFLYQAARGTWFFHAKRLMLASLFLSAYALLQAMLPLPAALHAFTFVIAASIAFPLRDRRLFIRAVFLSAVGLLVFGSAVRMCLSLGGGTLMSGVSGALSGFVCMAALKAVYQKQVSGHSARFRVRFKDETAEFTAIIDTGNLLREPLSALPVLIADDEALGKRFANKAHREAYFREAAFASVGGEGQMKCLRADEIIMNVSGKWERAPDMWLGLYPGRMRGSVHALAPPTACGKVRKLI